MFKNFISALFRKDKSFTLVELMLVMTIIMVITALVLLNYRAGGQHLALSRSANKLAQDIRRAQEMAVSAAVCESCGGIVPHRYGIYSDSSADNPTSYLMFADINNDGSWLPADDIEVKRLYYEPGVFLSSITDSACSTWPPGPGIWRPHITFSPPDPATELKVGWVPTLFSCTEIILTLQVGDSSGPTKKVKVNSAGLIYVE